MTCRPGHAPRHPDFVEGNVHALRHGAYSPRRVDPLASEMVAMIACDPTVTWIRPADRPALWSWARAEARAQLLTEWLADRGGDIDDNGHVRAAADLLTRIESQAMALRGRLGLDPLSRARLGRDTAAAQVDLARLWAADDADRDDDPPETGSGPHGGIYPGENGGEGR